MNVAEVEWAPGAQFSRYEMIRRLARGGMAEVWRAAVKGAEGSEGELVIKTMRPERAVLSDLVQIFINEATIAARLDHPGIIQVFDFGQLDGRYFMTMEYVPGLSLRQLGPLLRQRAKRLPRAYLLRIVTEISRALGYAHALVDKGRPLGFAHRDVSPENIMISSTGAAKLIDFGAATTRDFPPQSWAFPGKHGYLSPERLRGGNGDARTDVYSLGIVLYEYLTDRNPFAGPDANRLIADGQAPDPCGLEPSLPPALARVIRRAMAVDPAARYANGSELADELSGFDPDSLGDDIWAAREEEVQDLLLKQEPEEAATDPVTFPRCDTPIRGITAQLWPPASRRDDAHNENGNPNRDATRNVDDYVDRNLFWMEQLVDTTIEDSQVDVPIEFPAEGSGGGPADRSIDDDIEDENRQVLEEFGRRPTRPHPTLELERALSRDLDLKVAELASRLDSVARSEVQAQALEQSHVVMIDGLRRDLAEATARLERAPRPDVIDGLRHDLAIAHELARNGDERAHEMAGQNAAQRTALDQMASVVAERDVLLAEANRLKAQAQLVVPLPPAPAPAPARPQGLSDPAANGSSSSQTMVEEIHKQPSWAPGHHHRRSGPGHRNKR